MFKLFYGLLVRNSYSPGYPGFIGTCFSLVPQFEPKLFTYVAENKNANSFEIEKYPTFWFPIFYTCLKTGVFDLPREKNGYIENIKPILGKLGKPPCKKN